MDEMDNPYRAKLEIDNLYMRKSTLIGWPVKTAYVAGFLTVWWMEYFDVLENRGFGLEFWFLQTLLECLENAL